ncbi:hypothetical protein OE88DRAFT_1734576 [Heliocybe sulcata]|uniref:Methyltransferase domain-containing protein n=1 Tax=Heliocybe sulcata TaxID=5364 RepID=A0A5C3N6B2_9AGAM|nr:hypothetical protein OE88DRAFT_1734576 [Heliocybe sulcata]
MLNPYPTRLRAQSTPGHARPTDRAAVPALPFPNQPSGSSFTTPSAPPPKPKSRPLTFFASTAQLARKVTPRRRKSVNQSPEVPSSPVIPPPARPPRNPARPTAPKRPSTSSGIPQTPSAFSMTRPSSSSGVNQAVMVWDAISPGGATITPFAVSDSDAWIVLSNRRLATIPNTRTLQSFADLRATRKRIIPKRSSVSAAEADAKSRSSTTETKSRSSNAASLSEHSMKSNNNLSTPDRAILLELKRSIAARDAQFVTRGGKKHHPYSAKVAPYPRSYERQVVDFDVWEGQFMQQVCGSVTWHIFEHPPTKVLDIGCGTGTWVLECAKIWKKCHFVGLDIVPLHPDLQQVGSADLASRITWTQTNFLEGLPFPNEEFDFVHVKRIARGVPEDKWDSLFEEISRVMKPGGAFEMVEEDLYFPGAARDPSPKLPTSPAQTAPSFPPAEHQISAHDTGHHMYAPSSGPGIPSDTDLSFRVTDEGLGLPLLSVSLSESCGLGSNTALDERSTIPVPRPRATTFVEGLEVPHHHHHHHHSHATADLVRTSPKAPVNPRDHSLLETIYAEMHGSRFINLAPLSLLGNYLSSYFKDVRTHPPIIVTFPPPVGSLEKDGPVRSRAYEDDDDDYPSASSDSDADSDVLDSIDRKALEAIWGGRRRPRSRKSSNATRVSTYLSTEEIVRRTQPYVNLDSARRIAPSPSTRASILVSDDPEHPSLFSGPARRPGHFSEDSTPSDSAIDLSRDLSSRLGIEFAFDSPITGTPFTPPKNKLRRSTMPNKTFNFDLQSLNLHLAARVAEIDACSEAMWDWLAEYQSSAKDATVRKGQADDATRQSLLSLTRADFDNLVTQFELDMSDYTTLGSLLEQRCDWCIPPMQRTPVRKAFDIACKTWAEYCSQQTRQRQRVHSTALVPPQLDAGVGGGNIRRSKSDATRRRRPSSARPAVNGNGPAEEPDDDPSHRLSRTLRVYVAWKP